MINLIKKLLILNFLLFFPTSLLALNSSTFLISQSAFKNHDYTTSLSSFDLNEIGLINNDSIDKLIAAIIVEDLNLAYDIASEILLKDYENQEAHVVKLTYLLSNNKLNKINEIKQNSNFNNELIDFIFFNNDNIKDTKTVSKSFVDIVISSYSDVDQNSLNYNFLLFYISLSKLIDPTNDRAAIIKGELFQNLKKEKIARKIFENIKEDSPFFSEAQKSLAYNYSSFLPFKVAENNLKNLLENSKDNYSIKKILADFYRYEKRYELAISIYNDLINLNMDDVWNIYYMRGICYERMDNWNKAEEDFITSLSIKSNSPNVLNYLAYGWVERGIKLNKSLNMLKEAYESNPDSYYIIDSLAWAHFKKNNLEEAARLMEMVIDMAPGEAISLDHLGDIYYAMNRKREAIHFWQQAFELAEPEDEIKEGVRSKLSKFNAG